MFPAINVFSVITVFSVIIIFSSDLETDSIGYEESDLLWYIDNETVPPEIIPLMDQLAKVGTQECSYICKSSHSQLWLCIMFIHRTSEGVDHSLFII